MSLMNSIENAFRHQQVRKAEHLEARAVQMCARVRLMHPAFDISLTVAKRLQGRRHKHPSGRQRECLRARTRP